VRGRGTKLLAVADRQSLPIAGCAESASPQEVKLVHPTLAEIFVPEPLERLVGDNAYDSDSLDAELAASPQQSKEPYPGWPLAPALSPPLENGTLLCLAAAFPPYPDPLGISPAELPRHGPLSLRHHPPQAFMRCVLFSNLDRVEGLHAACFLTGSAISLFFLVETERNRIIPIRSAQVEQSVSAFQLSFSPSLTHTNSWH
jgi:hypothetical protein